MQTSEGAPVSTRTIDVAASRAAATTRPRPHDPRRSPFSTGMGTASGLDRQTSKVSFSAVSSAVATAARRVHAGLPLDDRETDTVRKVQSVLNAEAHALRESASRSRIAGSYTSYSFAQVTHSALNSGRRRKRVKAEDAAAGLEALASDIERMLTAAQTDARTAAERVASVFSRISGSLLTELGIPGDSLGGRRRA